MPTDWACVRQGSRDHDGIGQPSLAGSWRRLDDETLELEMRRNAAYQDGEPYTAAIIKRGFDKVQEWAGPHPPGAFLNFAHDVTCEAPDAETIRMQFPGGDPAAVMKLRGMHLPSTRFWNAWGFIDPKTGSAEGHWWGIDALDPWGTGPFVLTEGVSPIESRSDRVVMEPNHTDWNPDRKPTARIVYDDAIGKAEGIAPVAPVLHAPTTRLDVRLRLLASEARPLRDRTPVQVHLGAAAVTARVLLGERQAQGPPGTRRSRR